ncbi:hypothetical protein ACA910_007208 [Epithemia clementina (nom. ined.)]
MKMIGVIGATGSQGGWIVKKALEEKQFKVRAFTRDPFKESSVALKDAGAEVVAFDMDKPEAFLDAFEGLHGLFVVTNYWEHMSPSKEKEQVKAIVEAAEKAGVQHYTWSTLEDTTSFYETLPKDQRVPKLTEGYCVPHFDGKHEANAYFPKEKTTFLYTSFYLDNFRKFNMLDKGVFCNNVPSDAIFPVIASEDIGKCAYGIFQAGDEYKGKNVFICGEKTSLADIMKTVSNVTGKTFSHVPVDRATYAGFDFPGADDLANMFDFNVQCQEFCQNRTVEESKKLNPELKSVREWATVNKETLLKLGPD